MSTPVGKGISNEAAASAIPEAPRATAVPTGTTAKTAAAAGVVFIDGSIDLQGQDPYMSTAATLAEYEKALASGNLPNRVYSFPNPYRPGFTVSGSTALRQTTLNCSTNDAVEKAELILSIGRSENEVVDCVDQALGTTYLPVPIKSLIYRFAYRYGCEGFAGADLINHEYRQTNEHGEVVMCTTPLRSAVMADRLSVEKVKLPMVRLLLEHGANANHIGRDALKGPMVSILEEARQPRRYPVDPAVIALIEQAVREQEGKEQGSKPKPPNCTKTDG